MLSLGEADWENVHAVCPRRSPVRLDGVACLGPLAFLWGMGSEGHTPTHHPEGDTEEQWMAPRLQRLQTPPQETPASIQREQRVIRPLSPAVSYIFLLKKFKSVLAFPMPALFILSAVGIRKRQNSSWAAASKSPYWICEDSKMTVTREAVPVQVSSCLKLFLGTIRAFSTASKIYVG